MVARLTARPRTRPDRCARDAAARAATATSTRSPADRTATGWPFGRPVQAGEVYAVLQRLPGTEIVEDVRLFAADPMTGQRGEPVQRIDIGRHALVFSFEHQVRVGTGG